MSPVRLALIGVGTIGSRHLRLMQNEPDCKIVAVADPVHDAKKQAEEVGVPYFADYAEMLSIVRPAGAIVATPNELHTPVGTACAEHGIHILMEKPVAHSVAAAQQLVDAVRSADVSMTVGHHRRFDPAVVAAETILSAGEIGKLVAVSGLWALRKQDSYYNVDWRRGPSGGPILINLIHDIDMLRYLCGEIDFVFAQTSSDVRGFAVEDTCAILFKFRCGVLATMTASDATPSPWGWEQATGDNPVVPQTGKGCYRFLGTAGSLEFPSMELWRHTADGIGDQRNDILPEQRPQGERSAFVEQLRHFCELVRGNVAPKVSGEDALATLAATTAVIESAKRGETVRPLSTL